MKIAEISRSDRPQERLIGLGPEYLNTAELIALVIRSGTKKASAIDIANNLLSRYPIHDLSKKTIKEITKIKGIGPAKACKISACIELSKRIRNPPRTNSIINNSIDAAKILTPLLKDQKQEIFYAMLLDSKNRVICLRKIFIGTLDCSIVHPREILKFALSESSASMIIAHNHPSGDPKPSKEDIKTTERLFKASQLIGINLIDHLIIGDSFFSFSDSGLIL